MSEVNETSEVATENEKVLIEECASSCSSDDSDIAFANMDFAGVDFDGAGGGGDIGKENEEMDAIDREALDIERQCLLLDSYVPSSSGGEVDELCNTDPSRVACLQRIRSLADLVTDGKYVDALKSESSIHVLGDGTCIDQGDSRKSVVDQIRSRVLSSCTSVVLAVEAELFALAAFNLFLQINYTGPSLDDKGITPKEMQDGKQADALDGINPHPIFRQCLQADEVASTLGAKSEETKELTERENASDDVSSEASNSICLDLMTRENAYHNAVLSELCVDGDWPCQVCDIPYMLLLARSLLSALADPQRPPWSQSFGIGKASGTSTTETDESAFSSGIFERLQAAKLLCARVVVAHQRLLQGDEPSLTLWDEVESSYEACVSMFCSSEANSEGQNYLAARVMLEWGLAQHHFNREGMGKKSFKAAMDFAGLDVEVTGAEGRRTKYQQNATAQYLVKAKSSSAASKNNNPESDEQKSSVDAGKDNAKENVKSQMIEHDEENILLERVKFVDDEENKHYQLSELDLSILLALCLDVKNDNPMDGLTAEQMGGYLERILQQHDDWMIYATALLERAWLECERNHSRERAILQIQALCDQHTQRLTMTQSTFKAAVEDSAPPQERLRNLHYIVYPPRWAMLRDLAERYAKLGVVSSAAEIFVDLELWDEVVECYQIAGKENQAEKIVRQRLAKAETPRMWAALGDLTKDPACFEKALEVSNGRFASAHVALGVYHSEKGNIRASSDSYQRALDVKPLQPAVWFRLGTVSMRLDEWDTALNAFTEVVQQEPEEGDAWANIAAIHMHNKDPASAYPALIESLKQKRNNWRVWISKLYTCIDLKKYDEAVQACNQLLDFKMKKNSSEDIPPPEEKCVRAIVGGVLVQYKEANEKKDDAAIDSTRRTLSRVRELLSRLGSTSKSEPWVWEVSAFFNDTIGLDEQALEDLMKEYRALQSIRGWETDEAQLIRVCRVVNQIYDVHKQIGKREDLVKFKLLLKGVIKKIESAYFNREIPEIGQELSQTLMPQVEAFLASK